ncbi:protein kinase subdomain-containing protein PKL/CAK/Fmp29 [Roridomyces roridus]|uniref:Protein kinase subdomain-containing protein PKL/CAK/Fmp29 n=1 Tax=Roridomyces roridus TaxID=1738132 RepID=A0AAD7BKT6_9AGAR|nr:protein kinase subdomain-containing protein PKL/CAK/Fmp29 [Roridomyces roridus]
MRRRLSAHVPLKGFLHHFNTTSLRAIRRTFKTAAHPPNELFDYTSGRWIFNDALRLSERRTVFNVTGLRLLAAQSVGRSSSDILSLTKLAEAGFNRCFLITMRDGFKMVARLPYVYNRPSYHVLASEVATMDYLRGVVGMPIPEVYGYAANNKNLAETEYIFMEYVHGTPLGAAWSSFGERETVSLVRQLVHLEVKMMGVEFPAGGSLYYARDLEQVGDQGIPLPDDARFCIGPDVRRSLWQGRRSQLEVSRGPYKMMEEALVRGAHKELAFLERFGQPLLPFDRARRAMYDYQEQHPSEFVENLNRYLLIAPSIVPQDSALRSFRIRHPDLTHENNILVSRTADSDEWKICSLIDWQHASILPISLLAGIPPFMRNRRNDRLFDPKTRPVPPPDADRNDDVRAQDMQELLSRLKHYQYLKDTEELNPLHHIALTEPQRELRRGLFKESYRPWDGETFRLRRWLVQASEEWDALAAHSCPLVFDSEYLTETSRLREEEADADFDTTYCHEAVGCASDGWVPNEAYQEALAKSKKMKANFMAYFDTAEEQGNFSANWMFDDMSEDPYM